MTSPRHFPPLIAALALLGLTSAASWWGAGSRADAEPGERLARVQTVALDSDAEAAFISSARQLTLAGLRAGEGYFSADGNLMIFQSEREPGNPFFQIYLMDLLTGDTHRVSPGHGKTTCAWIHPDGDRVLFASTHQDDEAEAKQEAEYEERASGRQRRYAWDYDKNYDIFTSDPDGANLVNLTNSLGYDAEGAWSPCGGRIVFASNRLAYQRELTDEERERFELNQSFLMDLYLMDSDGGNVQRITDHPGYDGGPFFSACGEMICWRRFNEKGDSAEIWVMDADGGNQRQVTQLGALSWAPFFHPSGDYLIFASNLQGFDNFELYLVDTAGTREPVRVTHTHGFDGLPVFAPCGGRLSWTSNRSQDGTSQIFLADWDHDHALASLEASPAAEDRTAGGEPAEGAQTGTASTTGAHAGAGADSPADAASVTFTATTSSDATAVAAPEAATATLDDEPATLAETLETSPEVSLDDLRAHVEYLASEELEGRLTGTEGERLATAYAARLFERYGLEPAGDNGTFFQEFEFTAGIDLGEGNRLMFVDSEDQPLEEFGAPEVDTDWRPLSYSQTGVIDPAEIVFAGYGIEIPEEADGGGYSSYFHLDVEDKWVLVFRFMPENLEREDRRRFARYSSLRHKAMNARRRGARGLLVVSGPNSQVEQPLVPLGFDASLAGSGIGAVSLTDELGEQLVAAAGHTLQELQDQLDDGELIQGFTVPGIRFGAEIDLLQQRRTGRNVLARLRSESAADDEPFLVVGAHIDHLGDQGGSASRARGDDLYKIHPGADDNASGVAALLEIAEQLADWQQQGRFEPRRDIVFAAWSGEELGLLGVNHYVRGVAADLLDDDSAPLTETIVANLNMDMIGRFEEKLILQGAGSSEQWPELVERANVPVGLPLVLQEDPFLSTDAAAFYARQVPILNAFTGAHEDYHTPADTADKINYEGLETITRFMLLLTRALAIDETTPVYQAIPRPDRGEGMRGMRVFLGTIPDYSQGDVEGVRLSGVAPDGPAAEAGVKSGDTIVELGGEEIKNIYDYTYMMGDLQIGEETSIVVLRDGERVEMKITPASRQ